MIAADALMIGAFAFGSGFGRALTGVIGVLLFTEIVVAVFLTILHSLGGAGMFMVFDVLALAAFTVVYRFAPETKGRQPEDIRHFWKTVTTDPPGRRGCGRRLRRARVVRQRPGTELAASPMCLLRGRWRPSSVGGRRCSGLVCCIDLSRSQSPTFDTRPE
jgi:hypothetical protein